MKLSYCIIENKSNETQNEILPKFKIYSVVPYYIYLFLHKILFGSTLKSSFINKSHSINTRKKNDFFITSFKSNIVSKGIWV